VASYELRVKESAAKELRSLPAKDPARIAAKIAALGKEPRPTGCEKLSGEEKYRLRQGDYRILYSIDDGGRVVMVVKVGHRREVYRS
jgi:mRNA interferase RelE/StbE